MGNLPGLHPNAEHLRDFIRGKLADVRLVEDIEQHIEICPECCEMLESIGADTFEELVCDDSPESLLKMSSSEELATISSFAKVLDDIKIRGMYEDIELVVTSRHATVYKALSRSKKRPVALKIIEPVVHAAGSLRQFKQEVLSIGSLEHASIVSVRDAIIVNGFLVIASDWVDGISLAEMVQQHGPLNHKLACDYVLQIAYGLRLAHIRCIIHGNLKPTNIMLDAQGTIRLLGLGLATAVGDRHAHTAMLNNRSSQAIAPFASPEQVLGMEVIDQRVDIYSLGCIFYFLVVGRSPNCQNPWSVLHNGAQRPSFAPEIRKKLTTHLLLILQRMLAVDRNDRFTNLVAAIGILEKYQHTLHAGRLQSEVVRTPPSPSWWRKMFRFSFLMPLLLATGAWPCS